VNVIALLIWLAGGVLLLSLAARLTSASDEGDLTLLHRNGWLAGLLSAGLFLLFLLQIVTGGRLTQLGALAATLLIAAVYTLDVWRTGPSWKWILLVLVAPGLLFISSGWNTLAGLSPRLLLNIRFYFQWTGQLNHLFDLVTIFLALAGVLLAPARGRWAGLALWAGYAVFGLVFPGRVIDSAGQQVVLIPVVALSLGFLANAVFARIGEEGQPAKGQPPGLEKRVSLPWGVLAGMLAVVILGVFLRTIDLRSIALTGSRPLHSAIVARGIFYSLQPQSDPARRQTAIDLWKTEEVYEPPILESMVALGYLLVGREALWVQRLLAIFFGLVGGVAVFDLARQIGRGSGSSTVWAPLASAWAPLASAWVALASMAFFLLSPFAVAGSRWFQPDLFMAMWIVLAADVAYRWARTQTWPWAVLAGLACGIAILVKVMAVFPVVCLVAFLVISRGKIWQALRNSQVWVVFIMMAGIPSVYYLLIIPGRSSGFFEFWTVSMLRLLTQPGFYRGWYGQVIGLFGLPVLALAFTSILITSHKNRMLLAGLWLGYLLFAMAFPSQVSTHDYYHIMLLPVVSLSLVPVAVQIASRAQKVARPWQIGLLVLALGAMGYTTLITRNSIVSSNVQPAAAEAPAWEKMGRELPTDGPIIALTHDYGKRIKYYGWREVSTWPYRFDFSLTLARGGNLAPDFPTLFNQLTKGYHYFLVTLFDELENQPDLRLWLKSHYAISSQGDGYILYDLSKPK
jgi:hypothetical protein